MTQTQSYTRDPIPSAPPGGLPNLQSTRTRTLYYLMEGTRMYKVIGYRLRAGKKPSMLPEACITMQTEPISKITNEKKD